MSVFPRVIRVGHVILSVADLAASRHFYVDLLGLNVVMKTMVRSTCAVLKIENGV
jgi:catechol 2,3-dioxygenase-like lactoylglutathione lyase family enzyme